VPKRTKATHNSPRTQANGRNVLSELKRAAKDLRGAAPLTARGVADLCGVELKTVHNWAGEGRIRHFRTPGRHLRFQASDVVAFLEECGYQLPTAERRRTVVAVARGSVRTALRRALKACEVTWEDQVYRAMITIERLSPSAVILEARALSGADASACVDAIARTLPHAKVVWVGSGLASARGGVIRVPETDVAGLDGKL